MSVQAQVPKECQSFGGWSGVVMEEARVGRAGQASGRWQDAGGDHRPSVSSADHAGPAGGSLGDGQDAPPVHQSSAAGPSPLNTAESLSVQAAVRSWGCGSASQGPGDPCLGSPRCGKALGEEEPASEVSALQSGNTSVCMPLGLRTSPPGARLQ